MSKFGIFLAGLMFLAVLSGSASAEPTVAWTKSYDFGGFDYAQGVAIDSMGNVVVTGWSGYRLETGWMHEWHTIKYDSDGNELWEKTYECGSWCYANGVAVDSTGNVIVTGWAPSNSSDDYMTIKYDSDGNELWTRAYDGGGHDWAYRIAVDSNDNVIVTGLSEIERRPNYYTIKYDSSGNELWAKSEDGGNARDVAVDSNDNVIVTGRSYLGENYDYYTIKYDSDGTLMWTREYDVGADDYATGVAVDSAGNVLITGVTAWASGGGDDYYTIKYDSDGNELWTNVYDGGSTDRALGVAVDSVDNVIVTGWSSLDIHDDYYTIKYDSNGEPLWAMAYDGGSYDRALCVAVDPNDNVIVTGHSNYDYYTIKYTEDSDSDGVTDSKDSCPETEVGVIVNSEGCSISQICPTDATYKNHGAYIKCVDNAADAFLEEGLITESEAKGITLAAKKSDVGKKTK